MRPSRQGLRKFMAGLGIVWLLLTSVGTIVGLNEIHGLQADHDRSLVAIAAAGKEEARFAYWLVQAQAVICSDVHQLVPESPTCPPVPHFRHIP